MPHVFSDLNLNGQASARVQPNLGEWGPQRVPSTSAKKRARLAVSFAALAIVIALFIAGTFFYKILMGA